MGPSLYNEYMMGVLKLLGCSRVVGWSSKYLESQWPIVMGYFGSFMGYFGV